MLRCWKIWALIPVAWTQFKQYTFDKTMPSNYSHFNLSVLYASIMDSSISNRIKKVIWTAERNQEPWRNQQLTLFTKQRPKIYTHTHTHTLPLLSNRLIVHKVMSSNISRPTGHAVAQLFAGQMLFLIKVMQMRRPRIWQSLYALPNHSYTLCNWHSTVHSYTRPTAY